MERWLGATPSSDAPGAGRSGARRRARMRAVRKKVSLNVAMESVFLTPAPSHATVDIRAAAAACGQATAASAVA